MTKAIYIFIGSIFLTSSVFAEDSKSPESKVTPICSLQNIASCSSTELVDLELQIVKDYNVVRVEKRKREGLTKDFSQK